MSTYIYTIRNRSDANGTRLVRAGSKGEALRHILASTYEAARASQEELVILLGKGIKVEDVASAQADAAETT